MMCLAVEQLHLRAESLIGKFEQGGGTRLQSHYIDEAIVLGREALEHCHPAIPCEPSL